MTKATSTHISLETAKLLEDCEIPSTLFFIDNEGDISVRQEPPEQRNFIGFVYNCYTWQEILWEHADKFFGENPTPTCVCLLIRLINFQYEAADLMFRENCILISQPTHE